jgi:hypothetical protein
LLVQTNRFNRSLYHCYLISWSVGKTFCSVLVTRFRFPSWASMKDWRKKMNHKLGRSDNAFSWCKVNFICNVRRFLFELPVELLEQSWRETSSESAEESAQKNQRSSRPFFVAAGKIAKF